jgi:hypothetical protein
MRVRLIGVACIGLVGLNTLGAQALREIVYTDWGRLCSIGLADGAKVCLPPGRDFNDPTWSPDGQRLVDGGILLDRTGRRVGRLQSTSGIRPAWSPDGRYIYEIDYELGSAVARWNADGTRRMVIPIRGQDTAHLYFQMLSFSPTGRRAALLTAHFREMLIADVTPTAFHATTTLPVGFKYVSESVWLDEDRILFVGKRGPESSGGRLWELTISTGAVRVIGIPGLSLRDQIVISRDRRSVVVTAASATRSVHWNLWWYELDSGKLRRLTSGTEDIVGSWR